MSTTEQSHGRVAAEATNDALNALNQLQIPNLSLSSQPDPSGQIDKVYDPNFNLTEALGQFDLQELLVRGKDLIGMRPADAGIIVIAAAIILASLRIKWRSFSDEDPLIVREIGWIALWSIVLYGFQELSSELLYLLTHLVGKPPEIDTISAFYYERMAALDATRHNVTGGSALSVDYWILSFMRLATGFGFICIQLYVYLLNAGQSVGLACLLLLGQLVVSFAALGGFFRTFAMAWLLLFIEICLWSPVMRIILVCLSAYGRKLPSGSEYSFLLDGAVCWVFWSFLRWTPKFAGMLVQGGGAAWMAPSGGAIGSAAATAMMGGIGRVGRIAAMRSGGDTKKALSWAAKSALKGMSRGRYGSSRSAEDVAQRYKAMQGGNR